MARESVDTTWVDALGDTVNLGNRALVRPDERVTCGLSLRVDRHCSHHLAAEDNAGHISIGDTGLPEQLLGGGAQGTPPISRILLCPRWMSVRGGIRCEGTLDQSSLLVVEGRLIAGGADVVSKDVLRYGYSLIPLVGDAGRANTASFSRMLSSFSVMGRWKTSSITVAHP